MARERAAARRYQIGQSVRVSDGRFRFGYQLRSGTADDLLDSAVAAEAAGFDVVHTSDHIGDGWPPLAPLIAVAGVTKETRLCPLVVNNDFRHPVQLAREVAALDHLTGGRMELGLGAGHAFTEYEAIGMPFDAPAIRKARMSEAVEILRQLLDGGQVSFSGEHYQLRDVRTMRSLQQHLPIMVGVNGRHALSHAARHADTISLTMLGRTLADGQRHETRWEADRLDRTVAFINKETNGRSQPLELHALVQAIIVTDDREVAAETLSATGGQPLPVTHSPPRSWRSGLTPRSPSICSHAGRAGESPTSACATSSRLCPSSNGSRTGSASRPNCR